MFFQNPVAFFCPGGSDPNGCRGLLPQADVVSVLLNAAYFDAALKDRIS